MNLRQMEAFKTLMFAGSVTAAAELLRLSQPTISKLIAQLERSTRLRLFERRKRRLVPTQEAVQKLVAARLAADIMGVPTVLFARTDAEAANLITSDVDDNDKPFLTGERTAEGFYRVINGLEQAISRGLAYAPYADLIWCETGTPDLDFAQIGRAHV